MTPEDYDAWYDTPRGRWIGEREWAMVSDALQLRPTDSVLDVGCGTGWFTRRAEPAAARVVGLDIDSASLDFARGSGKTHIEYLQGNATALPFPEACFDKVMSIAALCFVADWPRAVAEIVRVTRDRFAIGLLNRHGTLYMRKGRHGGSGAYAGAHWHTRSEVATALEGLPARDVHVTYGVFVPASSTLARLAEPLFPPGLPIGSFMVVSGISARP